MKAFLTLRAAPGNNSTYTQEVIDEVATPRAPATAGMASRTNHYVRSKIAKLMIFYFIILKLPEVTAQSLQ
jgi:hypothetical protein